MKRARGTTNNEPGERAAESTVESWLESVLRLDFSWPARPLQDQLALNSRRTRTNWQRRRPRGPEGLQLAGSMKRLLLSISPAGLRNRGRSEAPPEHRRLGTPVAEPAALVIVGGADRSDTAGSESDRASTASPAQRRGTGDPSGPQISSSVSSGPGPAVSRRCNPFGAEGRHGGASPRVNFPDFASAMAPTGGGEGGEELDLSIDTLSRLHPTDISLPSSEQGRSSSESQAQLECSRFFSERQDSGEVRGFPLPKLCPPLSPSGALVMLGEGSISTGEFSRGEKGGTANASRARQRPNCCAFLQHGPVGYINMSRTETTLNTTRHSGGEPPLVSVSPFQNKLQSCPF